MKSKSKSSYDLGVSLINNQDMYKTTQSIHCLYYSVVQQMKYRLSNLNKDSISYEEQDKRLTGNASHEWLLFELKDKILNPRERTSFGREFRELKKYRQEADYTTKLFNVEEAVNCREITERLLYILNHIN